MRAALATVMLIVASGPVLGQDTVRVQRPLVEFAFPIKQPPNGRWEWFQAATPEKQLEYEWIVRVPADPDYMFGFMLFKRPGVQPASGSLGDLLRAGQASTFRGASIGRIVPGIRPKLDSRGDTLLIALRDARSISEVFRLRPTTVTLELMSPYQPRVERRVMVIYDY